MAHATAVGSEVDRVAVVFDNEHRGRGRRGGVAGDARHPSWPLEGGRADGSISEI